MNISGTTLQGIRQEFDRMAHSADRTARIGTTDTIEIQIDPVREQIGTKKSQVAIQAGLNVIRTTDEMIGSLLDTIL